MKDQPTLDFYAREAKAYAERARAAHTEISAFLARLPAGARILELGCGGGQDSEAMLAAGYDVTPTDGSPELAKQAEARLGRPVGVLLFEDIAFEAEFDGVWANACLLHVPRPALAGVLRKVHRALAPQGLLYASFKTGGEERADNFGRHFNYPDEPFLREALGPNWESLEISQRPGVGYFNTPAEWLQVLAVKA